MLSDTIAAVSTALGEAELPSSGLADRRLSARLLHCSKAVSPYGS